MTDIGKKYLKISQTAKICGVSDNVLRYWEKQFSELSPTQRNARRYYQQKDVEIILDIKKLLMEQKYTLKGAKEIISEKFGSKVKLNSKKSEVANTNLLKVSKNENQRAGADKLQENLQIFEYQKQEIISELKSILFTLKT